MKRIGAALIAFALLINFSYSSSSTAASSKTISFQAEGWADNWYSLYVNGKKVGEDPVPITTTRSFNSTTIKFSASYPFTVGVIAKDYTENASGLEYIGKPNQQIGDGGFALQIRDLSTGKIVASTNKSWKALVVNKAPTNPTCERSSNPLQDCTFLNTPVPSNWSSSTYKDTKWSSAVEFSQEAVGVKDGYFDIAWSGATKLIWGSDLKLDNVILFRTTVKSSGQAVTSSVANHTIADLKVTSANVSATGALDRSATCDGAGLAPQVSWTTPSTSISTYVLIMDTQPGPPRPGDTESSVHSSLAIFDIPAAIHEVSSQTLSVGTVGLSFKGKIGYEPPCSQGGGEKIYTITVYGLSDALKLLPNAATQASITKAMQGKIVAKGKLDFTYARA